MSDKCGKGPANEQQHEAATTEVEEAMTSQGTNPPLGCMPASRTMQTGQLKDKATSNGSWQNKKVAHNGACTSKQQSQDSNSKSSTGEPRQRGSVSIDTVNKRARGTEVALQRQNHINSRKSKTQNHKTICTVPHGEIGQASKAETATTATAAARSTTNSKQKSAPGKLRHDSLPVVSASISFHAGS